MYSNLSTTHVFPKTLVIRNEENGSIWQLYHVSNEIQAYHIASNAYHKRGFKAISLEDYQPTYEETFPNWRMEMARDFVKILPEYLVIKEDAISVDVPVDSPIDEYDSEY